MIAIIYIIFIIIILLFFAKIIFYFMKDKDNNIINVGGNTYRKITIPFNVALNGGTHKIYINSISYNLIIPKGITSGKTLRVKELGQNGDLYIEILVDEQNYYNKQSNMVYKIMTTGIIMVVLIYLITDIYRPHKLVTKNNRQEQNFTLENKYLTENGGIYTANISNEEDIQILARSLTLKCQDDFCKAQNILNYVSDIPYKKHDGVANNPTDTIKIDNGDCNDKSNLLVSLYHALGIKAYLVLLKPKFEHIFVVVQINDDEVINREGLWINSEKFMIAEGTSKNSPVGVDIPLDATVNDIEKIIDPFEKREIDFKNLAYKI